jgi:ElaB/YqjD/DUF883 family membrane-anchored ribosome-binding protein
MSTNWTIGRGVLGAACVGAAAILVTAAGCASTTMAVKDSFGYAKREQLVDKVKSARDGQESAKEQFASALDEFMSVTSSSAKGSELEKKYESLKKEYDRSTSRADTVRSRIKSVETVGEALFKEWRAELAEYKSETMRATSERQMNDTRVQYDRLVGIMKSASSKMDPVLDVLGDQVLFLKHNLNTQAIASLGDTAAQVQTDVSTLIKEMEAAIAEADQFISQMDAAKSE